MAQDANVFDAVVPNYRRACGRWPDAPALGKYYQLLIKRDYDDLGLIECVKSFVESVCLTILGDFGEPMPNARPSLTELFGAALKPLGMRNTRGGGNVSRLLSAFNKLADALSDVRNEFGAIAHGKDGFVESLTRDENRAFLHTGDAILAILLNALDGTAPDLISTREPYERFQHFNERIDRYVQVASDVDFDREPPTIVVKISAAGQSDALELRIEPSRLLFAIDRGAFVEVVNLVASQELKDLVDEDETMWPASTEGEELLPSIPQREGSRTTLTAAYVGRLAPLRSGLKRFLAGEELDDSSQLDGTNVLASLLATADSNMAIDIWKSEARQARLRIALRRVIDTFYLDANAKLVADKLVTWLRNQSAAVETSDGADINIGVGGV